MFATLALFKTKACESQCKNHVLCLSFQNGGLTCLVFGSLFVTRSKIKDNMNLSDLSGQEYNFEPKEFILGV
jgi:hypothetical protein